MKTVDTNNFVLESGSYMLNKTCSFKVLESKNVEAYILVSGNQVSIDFELEENSNLKVVLIAKDSIDLSIIKASVKKDASLNIYESVISDTNIKNNIEINLAGENANVNVYEFVPAIKKEVTGEFVVNHYSPNATSNGVFHYVANKGGIINRDVTSNIERDMVNSKSSESLKGMIMSSDSKILAKPILKVSCDDVSANHGCAIGTIDDNEIYYLMSRGLTKEEAKRIIAMSLINPIIREIKDEEFKSQATLILSSCVGE